MMIYHMYLSALVFVIFLQYVHCLNNFRVKLIKRDVRFTKYEKWSLKYVSSPISCSWYCLHDNYCISLVYSSKYKTCIGLRSTYQDLSTQVTVTTIKNYNFYRSERAAPKLGSACESGNDCMTIPAGDCYSNRCRCRFGHSRRSDNTCRPLSECRRFSNKFELYKNVIVPRKEGRKFPLSSRKRCKSRCLRKRKFPCTGFEIDDAKNCYLQLATIFDVHPERASTCNHFQRMCRW